MENTHWSDVLGNELSAKEVWDAFRIQGNRAESFAEWLERQSRELWGSDHKDENWTQMAEKIKTEAGR